MASAASTPSLTSTGPGILNSPTWSGGKVYSGCIGTSRKKSSGKDQYDDMGREGMQRTCVLADLVSAETKLDLRAT